MQQIENIQLPIIINIIDSKTYFAHLLFILIFSKVFEPIHKLDRCYFSLMEAFTEVQVQHLAEEGTVDTDHVLYVLNEILFG